MKIKDLIFNFDSFKLLCSQVFVEKVTRTLVTTSGHSQLALDSYYFSLLQKNTSTFIKTGTPEGLSQSP